MVDRNFVLRWALRRRDDVGFRVTERELPTCRRGRRPRLSWPFTGLNVPAGVEVDSLRGMAPHAVCGVRTGFGASGRQASADHIDPGAQVVLAVWPHLAGGIMLRHATSYKPANDGQDKRAIQHFVWDTATFSIRHPELHLPRRRTGHRPGCDLGGAGVGLTEFSGIWAYSPYEEVNHNFKPIKATCSLVLKEAGFLE